MKELTPFEFVWLLRIIQKAKTWEHKRIASRYIVNTLTKQRKANDSQAFLLRYNLIAPFKTMI
jgi:hypothetical protein